MESVIRKLVADPERCSGCRYCEVVCAEQHEELINPHWARIRVRKQEEKGLDIPDVCRQCPDAPCAAACPVDAIRFNSRTGAWVVDANDCTGCELCVPACQYQAIRLHPQRGIAYKCDHCGGEPECVRICNLGALKWE